MPYTKENRVKFRKGKQKELIKISSKKVGSLRKLSKVLGVRFGYFWYYMSEQVTLPHSLFTRLVKISGMDENEVYSNYVEEILPYDWGRVKGSMKANRIIKKKLEDPKYRKRWFRKYIKLRKMMKGKMINNWELGFRNVGRRRTIGPKGEKMFNLGEKRVGDFLISKGLGYVYEPKLKFDGKVYFPDFVSGDLLIERFGMSRPFYLKRSKEKIRAYLKFWDGKIAIIVPKRYLKFYTQKLPKHDKLLLVPEEILTACPE